MKHNTPSFEVVGEEARGLNSSDASSSQNRPALRFQKLRPSHEQIAYVKNLELNEAFYNEHVRASKKEERFYGTLGEVIMCDAFNEPRPTATGDDGGIDFYYNGVPIDVKVRVLNAPPKENYYVRVYVGQVIKKTPENLHYIFLLYNPGENAYYVAGIMSKEGFLNTARLFMKGDDVAGNYVIEEFKDEEYNTEIFNLAVCNIPGV